MSWQFYDPDEWELDIQSGSYGKYPGTTGLDFGWLHVGQKRRAPEEVARLKAEKQRAHEDAVLAEADEIRRRRGIT